MPPVALTIAGSDPGGAAGLQADLKTFHAFGVYGASVVTALTAQDTTAVHAILHVDPRFVGAQLDAVLADLPVAAAKTGMFGRAATVEVVSARLAAHPVAHLVVDPVLFATAGQTLTEPAAVDVLRRTLLPLATARPVGQGSTPLNHLVTPERGNDECTPHRIAPPSARC